MSNKVFGEQVIIIVKNETGQYPLITNFDSANIDPQIASRSYKAISKRVHQHQSYNSGYTIPLTRAKRDNYIQSLIDFNDWCIQKGLEQPVFTIEEIITHTYSVAHLDPKSELGNYIDTAVGKYLETIGDFKSRYNKYISQATSIAGRIANKNQLENLVSAMNTVNSVNNFLNKGLSKVQSFSNMLESTLPPFKERYIYHNCVISTASHSHEPKNNTVEKIEFKASYRTDASDKNEYTDVYLGDILWNNSISNIEQNIRSKQDEKMMLNPSGTIPYQKDFASILLEHLQNTEELYKKFPN